MEGTIQRTLEAIDVKAVKRRINATTPPTDILHRATLLNTAFTPLYTHVFMALPVETEQLDALRGEQLSFLWTKQKDGQTVRKRSLVSKKRLHGSHEVGGLNIPNLADIVTGLHQNLIQKLYKKSQTDPDNLLLQLLEDLLTRTGRPSLRSHVEHLGPVLWRKTATALARHNAMFSKGFKAVAELLVMYEGSQEHWHLSAIAGHTITQEIPVTAREQAMLLAAEITTVSQLYETTDAGWVGRHYANDLDNMSGINPCSAIS